MTITETPTRLAPARTPRVRPYARHSRGGNAAMSKTVVNGILVLVAIYTFFPFVWTVMASTKDSGAIQVGDVFSFNGMDIVGNFKMLADYQHGLYFQWLGNSFLYAGIGAVVGALVCVAAGYAFDKYDFWGKEKWFLLVLAGVLVPAAATALPLYLLASAVHMVNTYWAVLIPSLVNPFGVYLARIFSAGYIPNEVLEAARIDGAGEFGVFRRIALPMIGPGYVTVLLFQFSGIWNNFFLSLVMLTNTRLFPVSLGMYELNSSLQSNGPALLPMVMLGSLLSIIPLVIIFLMLQRYWRAGLTAGSVK